MMERQCVVQEVRLTVLLPRKSGFLEGLHEWTLEFDIEFEIDHHYWSVEVVCELNYLSTIKKLFLLCTK